MLFATHEEERVTLRLENEFIVAAPVFDAEGQLAGAICFIVKGGE